MNLPAEKNRRVLVIDDNRAIHDDFRKILGSATAAATALDATEEALFGVVSEAILPAQFEIDSAYQGQEGVLLAARALEAGRPYAMAFVDVRMPPGWDGVETSRKLWELDPNLQIVICTAYSDYSWKELFAKLGQQDGLLILKKPFDTVEAFQLAHALTEKWWLHQESRQKMEALESRVVERTSELQQTNHALQTAIIGHTRAEEALRESKQIIEGILDAIPVRVFWKDKNLAFLGCNALFARDAGLVDPKEIVGKDDYQMEWRDHAELYRASDRHIIESGSSRLLIEEDRTTPDGNKITLLTSKIPLRNSKGEISGVLGTYLDITERTRAEAALVEANALLETLMQTTTDGIYFKDLQSRFVHFSRAMLTFFRLTHPDELKGRTDFDFFVDEHARPAFEGEQEIIRTGQSILNQEEKETHRDGRVTWVLTSKGPWRDQAGNVVGTIGISRDITERKQIEAQLFQSQKLETVGKLAGGVAHEFNNILTIIIGQSELLLNELPAGNPLSQNANEIRIAAERAATLTRQLLAYGRKQFLRPESLDLNQVLAGMEGTIRVLMSGDVDVRIIPAGGLHTVKADAGQIEQVIMNMAMNARDAMPHGGKLTLETGNVSLTQESVGRYPELKPGDYVMLTITDTGTGMSAEVQARAFEPFFTTKDVGEGTGLGLSTCYGIVKQSGGHISAYSEPGRGATFKIYLPQVEAQKKPSALAHKLRGVLDPPDAPKPDTETKSKTT